MRRILPMVMTIIVVSSFVSATLLLAWSDSEHKRNGFGMVQTWNGSYRVGDYIEFYWNASDALSGSSNRIWNLSVANISSMVQVVDWNYDPSLQRSITSVIPVNSTFPLDATFAFNVPEDRDFLEGNESSWTFRGYESVSTSWGVLVCQHFNESQSSSDWSRDYWMYHGIMVRETIFIAPSLNQTLTLKATNLLEETSDRISLRFTPFPSSFPPSIGEDQTISPGSGLVR